MPNPSLIETLRATRVMLVALKETIVDAGHGDAMEKIVSLLGLVQLETERSLARTQAALGPETK